jgi:hypothetical protein
MTEDERDVLFAAKIGHPVPGKHALGTDDHIFLVSMVL